MKEINQKSTPKISLLTSLILVITLVVTPSSSTRLPESITNSPIIAILGQPNSKMDIRYFHPNLTTLSLPQSYFQWVEQAGAHGIFLPYDLPIKQFKNILSQVQGVLLPGGGNDLVFPNMTISFYQKRTHEILEFAKSQNEAGVYYPVYATCLGFQSMVLSLMGNHPEDLSCDFNDTHAHHPVEVTEDFEKSEIWYSLGQKESRTVFQKGNLVYDHSCGYHSEKIIKNPRFTDVMYLTGTSRDKDDQSFAAIIEHKDYPFFASQFHPEKNQFERLTNVPHPKDRETIDFNGAIITEIVERVKHRAIPYKQLSREIKKRLWWAMESGNGALKIFERVVKINRMYPGKFRKEEKGVKLREEIIQSEL